jgi:putative ATPase
VVANAVFQAVTTIGLPECGINLAHGVAYLSQCKKDRSANDAYGQALSDVQEYGNLPIPMNIRNAPTKLMKELGYGKGYEKYPVSSPPQEMGRGRGEVEKNNSYLPEKLKNKKYLKK